MSETVYGQLAVLVVDDQDFMRDLVSSVLRQIGFRRIDTASDGEAALKCVAQTVPKLIICDIEMAPMNGIEFIERLHKAGFTGAKRIATVFLTSHAEAALVHQAAKLGVDAFVVKPVKRGPFEQKIQQILKRSGAIQ
ncbi:MAG: response regulator [Alphaproteobacteria bacterium]|nr:response regulator [Alphaproteobacteria bacterium]